VASTSFYATSERGRATTASSRRAPDLRDIVACNWVSVARHGHFGACTPIIPDSCSDILLYDDDVPHVVGPDTQMRWAELARYHYTPWMR
jgi:hypothetical protein